jgi:hypothetical protein
MKVARPLTIGIVVIAILLLVSLAVALNSSVQTWAARRALARRPDLHGSVGKVTVGFQHTEVKGLKIASHGAVLTLPSLILDLPMITAAAHERFNVKHLVAKGWTLDLTQVSRGEIPASPVQAPAASSAGFSLLPAAYAGEPVSLAAAKAPALFRGIFTALQLPVDLSVDALELEGEVILPRELGHGTSRLHVILQGGGLGAGKAASFGVKIAGVTSDGGAMTLSGTISATMDTPRTFTQVAAKIDSSVSGIQFPDGVTLRVATSAERVPSGENYTVLVAGPSRRLANLTGELVRADSRLAGTWQLDLQDSDLTPFLLGRRSPTFTASGQGTFETGGALDEIHAAGALNISAEHLDALRPELASFGPIKLVSDFDLLQHGQSLRLERLNATIAAESPVASINGLQSFEFNLKTGELRVADPSKDLVGISLTGLPLVWARAFLGDLVVTGGDIRGKFALSARDGGIGLRTETPLTIAAVGIARANETWIQDVDLSLSASGDYTPRGWQAEVADLVLSQKGDPLLTLTAKAGRLAGADQAIKATGNWKGNLTTLARQPVVVSKVQLKSGRAQGEFSASMDGTRSLELKLALSELVAAHDEKLPAVNVEVRADIAAGGKTTFSVPVWFTADGRKSDILLVGTLVPGASASVVDARLTGENVVLQDVQLLGLLAAADRAPSKTAPSGSDAKPFWSALNGQITLALRKVIYTDTFEVSDVGGTIRLEPGSLKFDPVHAVFSPESDLKLTGGISFNVEAAKRYLLDADLTVNNFEAGAAFRALDPAKLPTVEGRVNVSSHINGSGANMGEVGETARGRFEVSSKGGVFRALATALPNERLQAAQSALSIVGGLLGGSAAETANATSEIVKILSEIPFDQLSLKAERDEDLNLVLKDFTLISPNVRLGGVGQVTYAAGKPLLQQALDMQITMGARGRLGELLGRVKLLKPEKDNLGYAVLSAPIKIGGTLAETDTSDLKNRLLAIALEKSGLGEALNKMLGGGK